MSGMQLCMQETKKEKSPYWGLDQSFEDATFLSCSSETSLAAVRHPFVRVTQLYFNQKLNTYITKLTCY